MSLKDAGNPACPEKVAYTLHIYPQLSAEIASCCRATATKDATAADVIKDVVACLSLDVSKHYVLVEVKESGGEEWVLDANDSPVHRVLLWPRRAQADHSRQDGYHFLLQERNVDGTIKYLHAQPAPGGEEDWERARRLVERGFLPWLQQEVSDLCNLPNLTEATLLENLKQRFQKQKIYTYVGSILIAINPFRFLPIYNPKYVQMYENHQLGKLEPHIFAIADVAYHTMLRKHVNQCIVISGESGSGKTQSTNFLIHCLTAQSQKGYASGVERTILGAGPVLEAFGNAKTAHNNNSSRFGKFIQVNYLENGIVRGAVVEKYLLEKSRLVSQEKNERNYHVFYYLLLGVNEEERQEFHLKQPEDYFYLNQHNLKIEDGEDLKHDFERLKQAMEMVGFLPATKKQIFSVLSAILYLGNITYNKRPAGRDEGLEVGPPEVLDILSQLLKVKRELLVEVLTKRKTVTVNDKLILPYSLNEAITARDSMAKSLYSALFDWIVLRINHALLNKKDMEGSVTCLSIGVLDIFGFEDFKTNSFEQFCINYANEQLQYYFNQHIFKLEQEEYQSEGIMWHNIDYTDNVACIHLISKKPTGLFYLLDEESNFPHATSQTLLAKFKQQHEDNKFFIATPVLEPAFIIQHFAGKVKYQIKDFREKNMDYMRPDIVALLRCSDSSYVRELIGMDPVAVFRWATLRAAIRAMAVFAEGGRQRAQKMSGVVRHGPRIPLGELQQANIPVERAYRKSRGTKHKQVIPKNLLDSKSLKLIVSMTLHDRTTKSLLHLHKKKKPPSISAQFQTSLNKLLETLGKAEPFFIRCIRSNSEKEAFLFDERLVLEQLKYTGMLETVRIRQTGYNTKYAFQEFIHQFRMLLPKGAEASKEEISALLTKLQLKRESYQIGNSKLFLKESAQQVLQDTLYREVLRKIVVLQSNMRMILERKRFQRARQAALTLQTSWRAYCAHRTLVRRTAAVCIQSIWRGYRARKAFQQQKRRICLVQALVRGYLQCKKFHQLLLEKKQEEGDEQALEEKETNGLCQVEDPFSEREGLEMPLKTETSPTATDEEDRQRAGSEEAEKRSPLLPPNSVACGSREKESECPAVQDEHKADLSPEPLPESAQREEEEEDFLLLDGKTPVSGPNAGLKEEEKAAKGEANGLGRMESPKVQVSQSQRGLEYGELQIKHVPFALEEDGQAPLKKEDGPSWVREEKADSESERPLVQEDRDRDIFSPELLPGSSQGEEAREKNDHVLLVDGNTPVTSLKGKEKAAVGDGNGVGRMESREAQVSQSLVYPERPFEGTPSLPSSQADSQRSKSQAKKMRQVAQKDLDRPPSFPIQRYQDDPSKLQDKREQWKVKKRKKQSSFEDLPGLAVPQPSVEGGKGDRNEKPLAPSRAQEPPSVLEAACPTPVPGQHRADGKSAFKSPLRKIWKRRPEKNNRKGNLDVPEESRTAPPLDLEPMEAGASSAPPDLPRVEEQQRKERRKTKKSRTSFKISKFKAAPEKWQAPFLKDITDGSVLKYLDEFLLNKINEVLPQKHAVRSLFFEALEEFRGNLKTLYFAPNWQIHMGYQDLVENFRLLVVNLMKQKEEKDVQLVLDLFQAVLEEFASSYAKKEKLDQAKLSKAQRKKRKQECVIEEFNGHVFVSYQVNILQSCEQCCSYIWVMEKACLCRICKLTCHKKCLPKIQSGCVPSAVKKGNEDPEPRHFGVCLSTLTSETNSVPLVMEKLLEYVEIHGLYMEGIYRKSGSANRMRELKQALEADPNLVRLDRYPMHTITGILKQWLRELPDPLMTFALYHNFLWAVELPEKEEQLSAVYTVVDQLPRANRHAMERLIFHLVKVALLETVNRMSPNALAIVFAPCLLRCPDNSDPLTSMKDVSKTTTCVEMIIREQMRKYKRKMDDIRQLEAAESIAVRRLSQLQQNPSKVLLGQEANTASSSLHLLTFIPEEEEPENREKELLMEQIQSIQEEKEGITYSLPELDQQGSEEEDLNATTAASM